SAQRRWPGPNLRLGLRNANNNHEQYRGASNDGSGSAGIDATRSVLELHKMAQSRQR
ncbi:hypothetical protein E4U22_007587, partial [Claviceps purpurea]